LLVRVQQGALRIFIAVRAISSFVDERQQRPESNQCDTVAGVLTLRFSVIESLQSDSYDRRVATLLARSLAIALIVAIASSSALRAEDRSERYVIFRSTDRGRSWSRSDEGLTGTARVNAFASVGELTLAGTDAGVYFSTDDGQTWLASATAFERIVRVLTFASLGKRVFAGTDGSGLISSSDGGRTWSIITSFVPQKVRFMLCLNERIYAGTDKDGVFVSDDRGENWAQLSRDLPSGPQVFALGEMKGKLFAGLYSDGLFMWSDEEQRWTKKANVSPLALASIDDTLIAGHNPGGILWSDDSGATWTQGTAAQTFRPPVSSNAKDGELLSDAPVWEMAAGENLAIAGAASGIFYSDDHGRTWTRSREGLPAESPGISFLVTKDVILAGSIIEE
jgi:photosystem II stability/assembly factor-like uncharacterized protein